MKYIPKTGYVRCYGLLLSHFPHILQGYYINTIPQSHPYPHPKEGDKSWYYV